ncbi:tandem C2 domains nuclear protein [Protopterus annectens]|uniref:tandem C2 domains nuclear protein n=1 Tax=Protopterus annectens TaxID=7888 RepID=UPI001CFB1FFC|nr:tandem C2 domains nuclear protein [Protopterus annectens]
MVTKEQEAAAASRNFQPVIVKPPSVPTYKRGQIGCAEDYLLAKLPPDGRDIPFLVPTLKPSYIQPRMSWNPNFPDGLEGSARTAFNDRKAELSSYYQNGTDSDVYNPGYILQQVSPRPLRHPQQGEKNTRLYDSSWDLRINKPPLSPGLSSSMFELNSANRYIQRYDSVSSVQSSTSSSMRDSQGSTPSLVTSSGDERELGKLNVRLCYNSSLEQVWITVVQCKDLNLPSKYGDTPSVCVKGIITLPKSVQFKSSVKDGTTDIEFMETFVFSIALSKLQTVGLVFRIQMQTPRKRTVGECSLSLRDLSSTDSDYLLDITSLTKSSCYAEIQTAVCFQPVSNRIQLQIVEAQNLPSSATPLSLSFFVKVEMCFADGTIEKRKTRSLKSTNGQVKWADTMLFPLETKKVQGITFVIKLYRTSMRRKHCLGQVLLGWESTSNEAADQWKDSLSNPEKVVTAWHKVT